MKLDDLIEDLKDGTRLLALLTVLSGEKLPVERGRVLRRPHFLSNANTALQFLQSKRIKLVNINSTDLVDGRPSVVLGLIWTIILYFQIEENTRQLEKLGQLMEDHSWSGPSGRGESPFTGKSGGISRDRPSVTRRSAAAERWKMGAKKALLEWVRQIITKRFGIVVNDFGTSWRDGNAFLALIHCINPRLVNLQSMSNSTNKARLDLAFRLAERDLGIARLLDSEDVDVDKPDEKSLMTLRRFKTLRSESEEKRILYDRLKSLVDSHSSMVRITTDSWRLIVKSWKKVNEQLSNWAWLLDAYLPGSFGPIGEWLKRAEIMLGTEEKQIGKPDELANILGKKIEEHKSFFMKTQSMIAAFENVKGSPEINSVSPKIIEYMQSRLYTIKPRAAQRKLRLQYLEHKYCLVAFLILVEAKLKTWAIKYGKEEEVQKILDQYRNFVAEKNLFKEYDRAFKEMQQVSEAYRKDTTHSKTENDGIAKFLLETNDRWRNISVELRCIQSLLEEVISYWRKFGELTTLLEEWLQRAFLMSQMSEEEKIDFFQDLSDWKEKHSQMNETGNFLSATCRPEVTQEIREKLILINSKWEQLFQYVEQYLHRGQIIRTQNDYKEGQQRLEKWIAKAQEILHVTCICTVNSIKSYAEQLKKLSQDIEDMEVLFKNVSKSFQALVQELPPDEIERMMRSLKQDKEQLVRVVTQLEAVDAGVTEINKWLNEAEGLLDNFSLQGSKETIQGQLDKHRVFFSRQLYFKSMLETKNRIYQSLLKTSNGGEYLDMVCLQEEIKQVNERFEEILSTASKWENKMADSIRHWESFIDCEGEVVEWLQSAEKIFQEKTITSKSTLEMQKYNYVIDS
ncbi:Nesprin-2, partial [Armadillidium vulgare]